MPRQVSRLIVLSTTGWRIGRSRPPKCKIRAARRGPVGVDRYSEYVAEADRPGADRDAVAIAMVDGPEATLPLIDAIAETGTLDDYYLLHATRADLLRLAGRTAEASESYRTALALAPTDAERNVIESRLQGR